MVQLNSALFGSSVCSVRVFQYKAPQAFKLLRSTGHVYAKPTPYFTAQYIGFYYSISILNACCIVLACCMISPPLPNVPGRPMPLKNDFDSVICSSFAMGLNERFYTAIELYYRDQDDGV